MNRTNDQKPQGRNNTGANSPDGKSGSDNRLANQPRNQKPTQAGAVQRDGEALGGRQAQHSPGASGQVEGNDESDRVEAGKSDLINASFEDGEKNKV